MDILTQVIQGLMNKHVMNNNQSDINQNKEQLPTPIQSIGNSGLNLTPEQKELYKKCLIKAFNKFIRDEISAAVVYIRFANNVKNNNVERELIEHAHGEFKHYIRLIEYAAIHGFNNDLLFTIDCDIVNLHYNDDLQMISKVQELEKIAIDDYNNMIKIAKKAGDIETCEFFKSLLEDEHNHFDELAKYLDQHRDLGE